MLRFRGTLSMIASASVVIALCPLSTPQSAQSGDQTATATNVTANDLVRASCANELAAMDNSSNKHAFRSVKHRGPGSETRLYVETDQAIAAMTVAYDGHPLTPQQMQGEEDHLNYLVRDPDARRNKHSREMEELDRSRRILKALPDAFLYEYDGTDTGTPDMARPGLRLTRLRFKPNPDYSPPSRIEQALVGMQGTLVLDPVQKRLALLDATLFRDVSFVWGFLGHLDKGGSIELRHVALDDGAWVLNRMRLKFTGKFLIFKSLSVDTDEVLDQFKPVPASTTFAQAVEILRAERDKIAASGNSQQASSEGAAVTSEVSPALIGKKITIQGMLSLRGKIAPAFVVLDNHQSVYLSGSWGWGTTHSEMEGKLVAATGVLKFYHDPGPKSEVSAIARPPDYFYLEAETTQLRLVNP